MQVLSLNIARPRIIIHNGEQHSTAIDKKPVAEAVELAEAGLVGDHQAHAQVHGGNDRALCVYAVEHFEYWSERLGSEIGPGAFGENLSTRGLLDSEVCIGDRYRVGQALLQVTEPRKPCWIIAHKHNQPEIVAWILETGYSGFFFRVLEAAPIQVRAEIELIERPHPDVTVDRAMRLVVSGKPTPDELERMANIPELSASWKKKVAKKREGAWSS